MKLIWVNSRAVLVKISSGGGLLLRRFQTSGSFYETRPLTAYKQCFQTAPDLMKLEQPDPLSTIIRVKSQF